MPIAHVTRPLDTDDEGKRAMPGLDGLSNLVPGPPVLCILQAFVLGHPHSNHKRSAASVRHAKISGGRESLLM